MARNATNLDKIPPWLENFLNFASLECLKMAIAPWKFYPDCPSSPFKRGTPFCIEPPLLRIRANYGLYLRTWDPLILESGRKNVRYECYFKFSWVGLIIASQSYSSTVSLIVYFTKIKWLVFYFSQYSWLSRLPVPLQFFRYAIKVAFW